MAQRGARLAMGLARGSLCQTRNLLARPAAVGGSQQTRGMRLHKERTIRSMYWRGRSFDKVETPKRRDEWQAWNYRAEIFAFSRRLQENLSENTLRQIFTHKSYVEKVQREQADINLPELKIQDNTALAKRGNKLLDDTLKQYLRHVFNRVPEDGIIAMADYLGSETVTADIASWIGCNDIILSAESPPNNSTMKNTVLALLGGIDTDLGLGRVRRFIVDIIISYLNDKDILDDVWHIPNPRETLNLILKNSGLPAYEPRLMFQTGVATVEPCHLVGLYVNQNFIGSSPGETLEIAEDCAALDTLQRMFDLRESRAPFVYGEAAEKIDYEAHSKQHAFIETWRVQLNNGLEMKLN